MSTTGRFAVTDPLTWRLARDTSYRHSPDVEATWNSPDVICWCGQTWPCAPRRGADEIMRALELAPGAAGVVAGADYAFRAVQVHVPVTP